MSFVNKPPRLTGEQVTEFSKVFFTCLKNWGISDEDIPNIFVEIKYKSRFSALQSEEIPLETLEIVEPFVTATLREFVCVQGDGRGCGPDWHLEQR